MPMTRAGGEELESSSVVSINGSFHWLLLPATGETLLPFSRSSRDTASGYRRGGAEVEEQLERMKSAAGTVGEGTLGPAEQSVCPCSVLLSLCPGSMLETPTISRTSEVLSPPSYFRSVYRQIFLCSLSKII